MPILIKGKLNSKGEPQLFNPFVTNGIDGDEDTALKERYTKMYRFRVPDDSIFDQYRDGSPRPFKRTRATTGIPTSTIYFHPVLGKVTLLFYEEAKWQEDTKRFEYHPFFIPIGERGVLETSPYDPEFNWFMVNHANNGSNKARAEKRDIALKPITFVSVDSSVEVDKGEKDQKALKKLLEYLSFEKGDGQWTWEQLNSACELINSDATLKGIPPAIYHHRTYEKNKENERTLRTAFQNMALKEPAYLLSRLEEAGKREVTDAIENLLGKDLLVWNPERRTWFIKEGKGKKEQAVLDVPEKEDHKGYLVKKALEPASKTGDYLRRYNLSVPMEA